MLDKQKIIERMDEILLIPSQGAQDFIGVSYSHTKMIKEFNNLFNDITETKNLDAELGESV